MIDTKVFSLFADKLSMRKIIFILFVFVLISCTGTEKETVDDNVSKETNIQSVVKAETETLSEGNRLFLQGEFERAVNLYQQGVSENRAAAFYNMGVSYFLMNDYENSTKYFEMALSEDKSFEAAKINLAAALIHLNELERAEAIIAELEKSSKSAKVFVNAANVYLKKGETARALYYFNKALNTVGSEVPAYLSSAYGAFLISIGEYDKGINMLSKIENKDYSEYFNLALGYYEQKKYDKSIRNLKNAINISPTFAAYDLMAKNYNKIHDYLSEADILSRALQIKRNEGLLYRYALALYRSGSENLAKNILDEILADYPSYEKAYFLYYDILINAGEKEKAGEMLKNAYNKLNKPSIGYLYAKHLILETEEIDKARRLLNNAGDFDFIKLGKAVYNLKLGKINKAAEYLKLINNLKNSDYYAYNAFVLIKQGKFIEALSYADQISDYDNKYLWYNFIIAWNTDDYNLLRKIADKANEHSNYYSKKPDINVSLNPVLEDFDLSFYFNGEYEDILRTMLIPVIVEPQQMIEFLALGYRLLSDNEKEKALAELKKSVNISEALKNNNYGVEKFFQRDFESALDYFQKADELMRNNPIVLYNVGLVYLNIGNLDEAFKYFDKSVSINKFVFPSFLGKAIVLKHNGKQTESLNQYKQLLENVDEYTASGDIVVPGIFLYSDYLGKLGLGRYNEVITDVATSDDSYVYLEAIGRIAEYLKNGDLAAMKKISDMNIFRGKELFYLMERLHNPYGKMKTVFDDNYIIMADNYLTLRAGERNFNEPNQKNRFMMKDFVYYNIYTKNMDNALEYLKELTNKHFRYGGLYKASLYYYLVKEDFTNAEASASVLDNLEVTDLYVKYYKILYYLVNYEEKMLIDNIKSYIDEYPVDYRGLAADVLYSFNENNFNKLYNDIVSLNLVEGNFLKKIPMELGIESL